MHSKGAAPPSEMRGLCSTVAESHSQQDEVWAPKPALGRGTLKKQIEGFRSFFPIRHEAAGAPRLEVHAGGFEEGHLLGSQVPHRIHQRAPRGAAGLRALVRTGASSLTGPQAACSPWLLCRRATGSYEGQDSDSLGISLLSVDREGRIAKTQVFRRAPSPMSQDTAFMPGHTVHDSCFLQAGHGCRGGHGAERAEQAATGTGSSQQVSVLSTLQAPHPVGRLAVVHCCWALPPPHH